MSDLRAVGFEEIKSRLTGMRLSVFDDLRHYGPCTSTELSKKTGMSVLSVRPRICELRQMCFVRETGKRRDGEHEFEALSAAEAKQLHEAAQAAATAQTPPAHMQQPPIQPATFPRERQCDLAI